MSDMPEVRFRKKSSWQKDDCINRSAEYNCPNGSTIEAVIGSGNVESAVRCCGDEQCKAKAAERARISHAAFSGQASEKGGKEA